MSGPRLLLDEKRTFGCSVWLDSLEYEQLTTLLRETRRKHPDSTEWIERLLSHIEESQANEVQAAEEEDDADKERDREIADHTCIGELPF